MSDLVSQSPADPPLSTKHALIIDNRHTNEVTYNQNQEIANVLSTFGYQCQQGDDFTVTTRDNYESAIREFCKTPDATALCIVLLGYTTMWGPLDREDHSIDLQELIDKNMSAVPATTSIQLFLLLESQSEPFQPQLSAQTHSGRMTTSHSLSHFLNSPNRCDHVCDVTEKLLDYLRELPDVTFANIYVFVSLLPLRLFHDNAEEEVGKEEEEEKLFAEKNGSVVLESFVHNLLETGGDLNRFFTDFNSQLDEYGVYEYIQPRVISTAAKAPTL